MSLYAMELDGLPGDTRVLALRGEEGLSRAYRFDVYLLVPEEVGADFAPAPGADATLRVMRDDGSTRMQFHGVAASVEFVQALPRYFLFRVVVRPRLWRLSLSRHSRVWVDKKFFPDVIKDVLKAGGLGGDDYELALRKTYPTVEHIGQWRESDFDFLSRWMDREGIYYFFEQGESKEKLVITDSLDRHERMPTEAVRFFALQAAEGSALEAMNRFRSVRRVTPTEVKLKDHDYLRPALDLSGAAPTGGAGGAQVSVFGGNLLQPAEAARLARVRADELGGRQSVFDGSGRVFELRPGYKFSLTEHPIEGLNGDFLATAVTHRGLGVEGGDALLRAAGLAREFAGGAPYTATVEAIRDGVAFRPLRRTPWPRVHGLEAAVVDGPLGDNYAELDEHGRYHVKIRFDESDLSDGGASCWVRMMQPHAGEPEGFHFPLRKGTEVMLAFLGGDPDRPVLVGAVPDARTPSPVTSSNRTQNVVMTGGENRIEIEDQAGSQYVGIYSPPQNTSLHLGAVAGPYPSGHNLTLTTDGTGLFHTGGDRDVTVGGNQTEDVQGNLTEDYHANQTTHVMGAFDETIDGGATQTISAGETRTVTGGLTETISGGETRTVNGGQTETVNGSVTRTVSASLTDSIGANLSESVGGDHSQTIGGPLTQTVTGGITSTVSGALEATVAGATLIVAPGGFTMVAPGGYHTVDQQLVEIGGTWMEYYASAQGTVNVQIDTWAIVREAVGVKIEAVGFKNDVTGAKREQKGAELQLNASIFKTCGAALYRFPAMIIT